MHGLHQSEPEKTANTGLLVALACCSAVLKVVFQAVAEVAAALVEAAACAHTGLLMAKQNKSGNNFNRRGNDWQFIQTA